MSFQTITIYVALTILILMLVMVGVMMYYAKSNTVWPPMISECPDYFEVVSPGVCNNVKGLGQCKGILNFTSPEFQGTAGLKQKKNWAANCGVVWDGITNNDSI